MSKRTSRTFLLGHNRHLKQKIAKQKKLLRNQDKVDKLMNTWLWLSYVWINKVFGKEI